MLILVRLVYRDESDVSRTYILKKYVIQNSFVIE